MSKGFNSPQQPPQRNGQKMSPPGPAHEIPRTCRLAAGKSNVQNFMLHWWSHFMMFTHFSPYPVWCEGNFHQGCGCWDDQKEKVSHREVDQEEVGWTPNHFPCQRHHEYHRQISKQSNSLGVLRLAVVYLIQLSFKKLTHFFTTNA